MKHYLSKRDAERTEGIINEIDDSIYATIEDAEMEFEAGECFAYDTDVGIRVAWTA